MADVAVVMVPTALPKSSIVPRLLLFSEQDNCCMIYFVVAAAVGDVIE